MQVYGDDFLYGDLFRASDYGFVTGSLGQDAVSDDEIMIAPQTNDAFLGENLNSLYISQVYSDHIEMSVTLIKNPCVYVKDPFFSEHDLRGLMRVTTGQRGWQWTRIVPEKDVMDTEIWYRARTTGVTYNRVRGRIVGVTLTLMTDGAAAYSEPKHLSLDADLLHEFNIYNDTDDINNYTYGVWQIKISDSLSGTGRLTILNKTDDNWQFNLSSVSANELITIDSKMCTIKSSLRSPEVLLNQSNLHFPRLLPGKNTFLIGLPVHVDLTYRAARKVGVLQ